MLQQHMVANRIYKCSQAIGFSETIRRANQYQHSYKCLLPDIFDGFSGAQSRTQLQLDQFSEVADKVLLGAGVSGSKSLKIRRVERKKLQVLSPQAAILRPSLHCRKSLLRTLTAIVRHLFPEP